MATPSSTPKVESKNWIEPFDLNFNVTKGLWNKETSENCFFSVVEKVAYVVASVFTAILETFQNALYLVANGAIGLANTAHNYFADKEVEVVKKEEPKEVKEPLIADDADVEEEEEVKEEPLPADTRTNRAYYGLLSVTQYVGSTSIFKNVTDNRLTSFLAAYRPFSTIGNTKLYSSIISLFKAPQPVKA